MKEKELEYQKKFRDYKRFVEDSNAEIQRMDKELSQKLIPEILKVVGAIGKKEGYTMILDVSAGGMAYHSSAKDITKNVIKEFDKAYKSKKWQTRKSAISTLPRSGRGHALSFPRKRESSSFENLRTPAFAGVTRFLNFYETVNNGKHEKDRQET